MNNALFELVAEIESWLAQHSDVAPASERWYAMNNVREFLADLESSSGHESIARAVKALNQHIVDQFDWDSDYSKSVSAFVARADRIGRDLARKDEQES